MRPDRREQVEAHDAAELARPHVTEILVVERDGEVRVRLPTGMDADSRARAEALRADPAAAMTGEAWRAVIGGGSVDVHGPTVHAFTDVASLVAIRAEVEQVAPWRLDRLRRAITDAEWEASGFAHGAEVVFGRFAEPLDPPAWMARATPAARRTTVAAAASLRTQDGVFADVGVLTDPAYRGRGLGTEVATAALDLAIRSTGLARWCADESDHAALAVARHLGFETWSRVLRVRLG